MFHRIGTMLALVAVLSFGGLAVAQEPPKQDEETTEETTDENEMTEEEFCDEVDRACDEVATYYVENWDWPQDTAVRFLVWCIMNHDCL